MIEGIGSHDGDQSGDAVVRFDLPPISTFDELKEVIEGDAPMRPMGRALTQEELEYLDTQG